MICKRETKTVIAKVIHLEAQRQVKELEEMRVEERARKVFTMTKLKAREKQDVVGNQCIKNKQGELKVRLEDRLKVWNHYMSDLLNKENEWKSGNLQAEANEGPVMEVTKEEVRIAMNKMKVGKAAGPSGVPVEVMKICRCEEQLAKVINGILRGERMPESWRKSQLVPLYKGLYQLYKCEVVGE
jgi:hypothetical protein